MTKASIMGSVSGPVGLALLAIALAVPALWVGIGGDDCFHVRKACPRLYLFKSTAA